MRIFLAGGTGVIGRRLIPLLIEAGHTVVATTRSAEKLDLLRGLGAEGVMADALDRDSTVRSVIAAHPDLIVHQLTDLSSRDMEANARLRRDGTAHLVEGARAAGIEAMVAQSISWVVPSGSEPADKSEPVDLSEDAPDPRTNRGVADLEEAVLGLSGGVVLRYGYLYGPDTWFARDGQMAESARAGDLPATETVTSFVHVDDAARAAVAAVGWAPGRYDVVDDHPAPGIAWTPAFAAAVGAPAPRTETTGNIGRPISNRAVHERGFTFLHPDWEQGFRTL